MLYLIMLVVYLVMSLGRNLLSGKGIEPPVELLLILSELVFLVPALIYVLARHLSFKEDLGFRPIKAGTFFMCLLLTFLVSPLATFFNVLSQLFVDNTMVRMSDSLLEGSNIAVLILGALYGPFCEEFVFRSVFNGGYEKLTGPLRAGLISAMLFALAHMNLNQAGYTFVLGFIFAIINKAAGSVYPSMVIHICINGANIVMLMASQAAYKALGAEADMAMATQTARESGFLYAAIGVSLVLAVICSLIAVPCIVFVAKHEGNLEGLKAMFAKPQPKGRWLSVPLVLAVLAILFIMFGLEPLLNILQ